MWVKHFADGSTIAEDRANGVTWLSTPLSGLVAVDLVVGREVYRLDGPGPYWHSRTATVDATTGDRREIAERIQVLAAVRDGTEYWGTLEWSGGSVFRYVCNQALGRPVN